jgi:hypothetical protein
MKEYTIKLCEYEIEILEDFFKYGEPALDSWTIEDALLRGILQQILEQK